MSTYDIKLWETNSLIGDYGQTPQYRVDEYLSTALNDYSSHSVNVTISDSAIDAPIQKSQEQFNAYDPCTGSSVSYDYLSEWWYDYLDCSLNAVDNDCHLLLTNENSSGPVGRCVGNWASVAEGGGLVTNCPSNHELYGHDDPGEEAFNAMQTSLHEIGHALMDGFFLNEHNVGQGYEHQYEYYRSPFHNPNHDYNECDEQIFGAEQYSNWYMLYSNCCESKMY